MMQTGSDMKTGMFQVLQAETATGIVLTTEGNRVTDRAVHVILADSLDDAWCLAADIVAEKPHIECSIRDHLGGQVEVVRGVGLSGSRKSLTWWQRLFHKGE